MEKNNEYYKIIFNFFYKNIYLCQIICLLYITIFYLVYLYNNHIEIEAPLLAYIEVLHVSYLSNIKSIQ